MRKRILSILLSALMAAVLLVPAAGAATTEDLNRPAVFLKQNQSGTCTLSSTAMMLRRAAMLRGDADWDTITEASIRPSVWLSGRGLPYHFTYDGITVGHERLPGGAANEAVLIGLLADHPEGIVLHASGVPHGVLLTDYTDGVFYCADPANGYPEGRIPLDQAYGTRVTNATAYWYVTAPAVAVEASDPRAPAEDLGGIADAGTLLAGTKTGGKAEQSLVSRTLGGGVVTGLLEKLHQGQDTAGIVFTPVG